MRIPVFPRRSNPAIDRPILRKSRFYAEQQVREGRADWVDYNDPRKGIVCRQLLDFGPKKMEVETVSGFDFAELHGVRFVPPNRSVNPAIAAVRIEPMARAQQNWDWNVTA